VNNVVETVVRETAMTVVGYMFMLVSWTVIIGAAVYCFSRILGDHSTNKTSEETTRQ